MTFNVSRSLLWAAVLAAALQSPGRAAAGSSAAAITDPALGMHAYTVHIPSGWKFQGTVFPGPQCDELPFPVYRAYSADGLTEMRMLPRFDWTFVEGGVGAATNNGCLPLERSLSAHEFLRYLAGISGTRITGDMTVAERVRQRTAAALVQIQQNGERTGGSGATGDVAAVRTTSKNGTFEIEQRLRAWVVCGSRPWFKGSTLHGCFARVDVLRAPKGKLDALARLVDDNDLNTAGAEQDFQLKEAELARERGDARLARQRADNDAAMKAQQERFEQTMAIQRHQHEQFMAQMQRSTDSSMNAATASMNARSTATSDWCDYALDLQTVTGSGGTAKVSSTYGHTWSNGQGAWYQTNNPNANPNGALSGDWTEQTVVHGNGTPK